MEKEGELFDEDYEMLPASWKELYRWFDSFCVTGESYAPMNWWNTPFRFSEDWIWTIEQGSGCQESKQKNLPINLVVSEKT
ncbi:MAG: hypothetical protein R3F38_17195 [Gammaproteobacteria bacterium]